MGIDLEIEMEKLEEEKRKLVEAMKSLLLAGTNASERIAIHHAKQLLVEMGEWS